MAHAKRERLRLVTADLNQPARNVASVAKLIEAGANFGADGMPGALPWHLRIISAFGEHGAEAVTDDPCARDL